MAPPRSRQVDYEILEHTEAIGSPVSGRAQEELFTGLPEATFDLIVDLRTATPRAEIPLHLEGTAVGYGARLLAVRVHPSS